MFRKFSLLLLLASLLLMTAAWSVQAANISVNINLGFNFVSAYPECPIPSQAVVIEPRHKHLSSDWSEYQVGYPSRQMIFVYQQQMPRNGWRYDHEDNGTFYWVKGHRLMRVMIIWISPRQSVVAFSETRIRPAHNWKSHGYKDQWDHGKQSKKHYGYKDDED